MKNEPIKISLPMFITIIVLLVAIVYGLYMYIQNEKLEREIADLSSEISNLKETENSISSVKEYTDDKIINSNTSNNNENINNVAGTWKVTKIYNNGVEETDKRILFGSAGLGEGLVLKKDGTFSDEIGVTISIEDSVEGSYAFNEDHVTLKYSNGAIKKLKYDSKNQILEFPNYMTDEYKLVLKKFSIENYKGVWQYFEAQRDIPEMELRINKIENDILYFDYDIYRITGFENKSAKLLGNTAMFEIYNIEEEKIAGTITLDNDKVILKINESTSSNVKPDTITFDVKSNTSILY